MMFLLPSFWTKKAIIVNSKVARNKIIVEFIYIPHVYLIDYNVNTTDIFIVIISTFYLIIPLKKYLLIVVLHYYYILEEKNSLNLDKKFSFILWKIYIYVFKVCKEYTGRL